MRAVVLERNPLVARKVVRYLAAAGVAATAVEDPEQLAWEGAEGAIELVCADAFDGELVAAAVRERGVRGVLWTAEPLRHALRFVETRGVDHVLARKGFDAAPSAAELVMTARRLRAPDAPAPSLAAYLDWGYEATALAITGTADRDATVARVQELVAALHVPRRVAELFGEVAHELVMNAIYGAPTDAAGRARYAHDRKADVVLAPDERATLELASDGTRLALRVRDPFGALARHHVVGGLARGLAGGELDRTRGGAGLGFTVVHHAATALYVDVTARAETAITAVLELDLNLRELRTAPRSLHLWGLPP
jgi:hypothetical protein